MAQSYRTKLTAMLTELEMAKNTSRTHLMEP